MDFLRRLYGPPPSYALTRSVFLRGLAGIYLIAFFSLRPQLLPLLGEHGLLPIASYLGEETRGGFWQNFLTTPTLFWLSASDRVLTLSCDIGIALSALALFVDNAMLMAALWLLYGAFVNAGQTWFAFGWEILLLETGFLAIFACPLGFSKKREPAPAPFWLARWLLFRVMFGAGLIKLRGDSCWRDLSCLAYHYETQPLPNPVSMLLHHAPKWWNELGVAANHFVELVIPPLLFAPRRLRYFAVLCIIAFQLMLIVSGNLSFLNWLTIVIALGCLDDGFYRRLLPSRTLALPASRASRMVGSALIIGIAFLSISPAANLFAHEQVMNGSFDRFHLVNTYGAFGSIERERREIIIEGTDDPSARTGWREYQFKCKPGDPMRAPCIASPYHYRLDWLMWFAAMGPAENYPWLIHLDEKLLHNDKGALSLLANNPFPNTPPRFVRMRLYRYRFAPFGERAWWQRELLEDYLPPLSAEAPALVSYVHDMGWND